MRRNLAASGLCAGNGCTDADDGLLDHVYERYTLATGEEDGIDIADAQRAWRNVNTFMNIPW